MGVKQWATDHRRKFDFANAIYRALIAGHVGLGIAILVGGISRFPAPTYTPHLELTNGEVWPWGVAILLSSLAMTAHGWWINMIGLGAALLWMNLFSAMFFAAYSDPTSSSTAPIPYMTIAMIIVALMTYKVIERRTRSMDLPPTTEREG